MWDRNFAVTIRQLELTETRCWRWHVDTLVIDADLVERCDVVVDSHFLAADDSDLTHLVGVQPAHVDGCTHAAGKSNLQVGHVFYASLNIGAARGPHRDRL